MPDIGRILSNWDIMVMILLASQPGLVIGAVMGALFSPPGLRARGGLVGAVAGFALASAGWWVYVLVVV